MELREAPGDLAVGEVEVGPLADLADEDGVALSDRHDQGDEEAEASIEDGVAHEEGSNPSIWGPGPISQDQAIPKAMGSSASSWQ